MSIGKVQRDPTSGKHRRSPIGKAIRHNSATTTCCCPVCTTCLTPAPDSGEVTFSGVTICTTCVSNGINRSAKIISGDLNGTWDLAEVSCVLRQSTAVSAPIVASMWLNATCAGGAFRTTDSFRIDANKNGGNVQVTLNVVATNDFPVNLFTRTQAGHVNCCEPFTVTNAISVCTPPTGAGNFTELASGGAADVIRNCEEEDI